MAGSELVANDRRLRILQTLDELPGSKRMEPGSPDFELKSTRGSNERQEQTGTTSPAE